MSFRILTSRQREQYGRFLGPPTPEQLEEYFRLDEADCRFARELRAFASQLCCAVQLGTLRFLGTFLPDPRSVPSNVVDFVAAQLRLSPLLLQRVEKPATWREQRRKIAQREGYRDFETVQSEFQDWLFQYLWLSSERLAVVFDRCTNWLAENHILLPPAETLESLIGATASRARDALSERLNEAAGGDLAQRLQGLLERDGPHSGCPLAELRKAPRGVSTRVVRHALQRWQRLLALGANAPELKDVPFAKIQELARQAASVSPSNLERLPAARRTATLLAFARVFEVKALDDAMDRLDSVMLMQMKEAEESRKREEPPGLEEAVDLLVDACSVFFDQDCPEQEVRTKAFSEVPPEQLQAAMDRARAWRRPRNEELFRHFLARSRCMQQFLPLLLTTVTFSTTGARSPLLRALDFLKSVQDSRKPDWSSAPREVISRPWLDLVLGPDGEVRPEAYRMCVLQQLMETLRRRDVFVEGADRWGDPRMKLIPAAEWAERRTELLGLLGRQAEWSPEEGRLRQQLDQAFRCTADRLPNNPHVTFHPKGGLDKLSIATLDALPDPPSLQVLRKQVAEMLPIVPLPELLLEVHARTGFLNEFRHVAGRTARMADAPVSVCAVLLARGCNMKWDDLVRDDVPALSRSRIAWVLQHFLRMETVSRANARLVEAVSRTQLARVWGDGSVATADGIRFLVPVASGHSAPNPKYFGRGRGITYYNLVSDFFTGLHGIVVPGTKRDSLVLPDAVLEQNTVLDPREFMTDTAGASDVVFALLWLLGYRFSPRLADVGGLTFWRMDRAADYGPLNRLGRKMVRTSLIESHWDDMLRLAASLKLGYVKASLVMTTLLRTTPPRSRLSLALAELGKILKTIHMLGYIDCEETRRRILRMLNHHEGYHALKRAVQFLRPGQVPRAERVAQEEQLACLALVVNAIVLWNTIYMDAVFERLRRMSIEVLDEDVARMTPLAHRHIRFVGQQSFTIPESVARGDLRPLKEPVGEDPLEQGLG